MGWEMELRELHCCAPINHVSHPGVNSNLCVHGGKVGKLEVSTVCPPPAPTPRFLVDSSVSRFKQEKNCTCKFPCACVPTDFFFFFVAVQIVQNHVSIFADGAICLFDWILKAKLYQIPQDDFVHFEGALTVATKKHDAAQIFFSFL